MQCRHSGCWLEKSLFPRRANEHENEKEMSRETKGDQYQLLSQRDAVHQDVQGSGEGNELARGVGASLHLPHFVRRSMPTRKKDDKDQGSQGAGPTRCYRSIFVSPFEEVEDMPALATKTIA
mmetsp:Transcript_27191/g.59079  ORF Transcript_27191/g.59079 Transcript_27191/m.59079 type:complete len:122 (-) Transcript_27191:415-780(-)